MKDLIEKLAQAEGPSDELDCRIHLAFNPELELMTDTGGYRNERPVAYTAATEVMSEWRGSWADFASLINTPRYTASIDAALTLVPEGWAIERLSTWPGGLSGCRLLGTHEHKGERWHNHKDGEATAEHAHLSIALCIAALSAKEPSQ